MQLLTPSKSIEVEKERADDVLDIVMDSIERKFDLSKVTIISEHRGRDIVDVRRMICNVMRSTFKLTYSCIGEKLNKDHSTIVYLSKSHGDLMTSDRAYRSAYNRLNMDVNRKLQKLKKMNYNPVVNGSVVLRELHADENSILDVFMSSFAEEQEMLDFIRSNRLRGDSIVYQGVAEQIPQRLVRELVMSDERRYVLNVMENSMKLGMLLNNTPVSKWYRNYGTGEYTIDNDPKASYDTACKALGDKRFSVIYMKRQ